MNTVYNTISRIESNLSEVSQKLTKIPDNELSFKPAPGKWSKKEILGHLCDSAVNNLARFIRAQNEPAPFKLISYNQDEWVKTNHYNDMSIDEIINIWATMNKQINIVMSKTPADKFAAEIEYNGSTYADPKGNKTLLWLFEDYLAHMEHHLNQLVMKN